MNTLDVLVLGATGVQGGAVANALLNGGHEVRALTRDPSSPAAESLHLAGATLCWADLDDDAAMRAALDGVDAVFAVTSARLDGPALETRRGLALIELARDAGVRHIVYSSAMPATSLSGIPHYDSKHEIEQYLRASGVPHTIVCPGFLMENLLSGHWRDGIDHGLLPLPIARAKLQLLAAVDLAHFVHLVLLRPEEFLGRRICLASDEASPVEMAATLARVTGRGIRAARPDPAMNFPEPWTREAFDWLDRHPGCAAVPRLRSRYPRIDWHTLEGWARTHDWRAPDPDPKSTGTPPVSSRFSAPPESPESP